MTTAAIVRCWTFISSRGDKRYQTLLYADGSTSCDCPGWCKRTAADGSRSCKHTRAVLMGSADRECESSHNYQGAAPATARATSHTSVAVAQFGQIGRRKIQTST